MKYKYSQLNLHPETPGRCNFNILSGDVTGTYHFKNGLYGITDTPVEFQNAIAAILIGLTNTYCFLDDILIVSCKTLEKHMTTARTSLKKLDDKNLRINLSKYHLAKNEIERIGYKITQNAIKLPNSTASAVLKF